MLILGDPCWPCSERGAFGFSNERSFTYWASTLSCGAAWVAGAPASAPPPLVVVIVATPAWRGRAPLSAAWLTQAFRRHKEGGFLNPVRRMACGECAPRAPAATDRGRDRSPPGVARAG